MDARSAVETDDRAHIMVVEDDASLARWMASYLQSHGYLVSVATDGDAALALIREDAPDLVVLDWMLPGLDGIEVCRRAREFHAAPIVMLTARTDEGDEIAGLETGADDYLQKPVRPALLLARVRALLRREGSSAGGAGALRVGGLLIDRRSRNASLDGEPLPLSSRELDTLILLAERPGEVVGRERLLRALRGMAYDGLDRSSDLVVSRLRRKIGDSGPRPARLKTVRGKGYLLAPDAW